MSDQAFTEITGEQFQSNTRTDIDLSDIVRRGFEQMQTRNAREHGEQQAQNQTTN